MGAAGEIRNEERKEERCFLRRGLACLHDLSLQKSKLEQDEDDEGGEDEEEPAI